MAAWIRSITAWTAAAPAPTKFYADLFGSLDSTDSAGPVTFTWDGCVAQVSPMGLSAAFAGAEPGDPDATVPDDTSTSETSSTDSSDDPYSTLNLNLPPNLANGTTVTLSMDSSLADVLTVYDGPTSSPTSNVLLGGAAGATSYTWTIGSGSPPPTTVYLESFGDVARDLSALKVTLAAPATNPATQPTTAPAVSSSAPASSGVTIDLSEGTFSITMSEASNATKNSPNTLLGASTHITFTPTKGFIDSNAVNTQIMMLQIVATNYVDSVRHVNEQWHIDDPSHIDDPFYTLPGAVGTNYFANKMPVWAPPQSENDKLFIWHNHKTSEITDVPSFKFTFYDKLYSWYQDWFETAAVVANGPNRGTILGSIYWGFCLNDNRMYGLYYASVQGTVAYTFGNNGTLAVNRAQYPPSTTNVSLGAFPFATGVPGTLQSVWAPGNGGHAIHDPDFAVCPVHT